MHLEDQNTATKHQIDNVAVIEIRRLGLKSKEKKYYLAHTMSHLDGGHCNTEFKCPKTLDFIVITIFRSKHNTLECANKTNKQITRSPNTQ